jgi:uncharacterized protein YdhG (YjbR/CyaY superfamily)
MDAPSSVDDYIASQPEQTRHRLQELRAAVQEAAPEATEVISYGMPTYRLGGQRVHFGAARRHCALYGVPVEAFAEQLQGYRTSRGTVQFSLDRPIPEELVRTLVAAKFGTNMGARQAEAGQS